MRKEDCIHRWLEHNFPSNNCKSFFIAASLIKSKQGKIDIANSMIQPITRRIKYCKDKLEYGKSQLGYTACLKEIESEIDLIILEIECFLSTLYKKEYLLPVKKLINALSEIKAFKEHFTEIYYGSNQL